MALTYPYALDVFADKLIVSAFKPWQLRRVDEMATTGGGDVLAAELAPPLWTSEITVASKLRRGGAAHMAALIESLDGPKGTFYLTDPGVRYPQWDPTGVLLGASTPEILSVGSNNKSIALAGLPGGYRMTPGDFLCWDIGSRRDFHVVVEAATADGSGETPEFELRPHLRSGVVEETIVTLNRPAAKVFIVPDSYRSGLSTLRNGVSGVAFSVMERPGG